MPSLNPPLPKMMLGFVVRRCAVALGHAPSPEEFAAWANRYKDGDRIICLFGRIISVDEARLILRHRGRPVTARSAAAHERLVDDDTPLAPNVRRFETAVARLRKRAK
jgi:hypothetical protein